MRRPTKDPYARPAIQTLERLQAELGGKILENKQLHEVRGVANRGTFSATFFLACLAAMELEGVVLEEI